MALPKLRSALRALSLLIAALGLLGAATPTAPAGYRIAVLEFGNGSVDRALDPLGKGLQAMITTDLASIPTITLVERERLADIKGELQLGKSPYFDKRSVARIGRLLGATELVAGTFTVEGKHMRIDWRLFSVSTGDILLADKTEGDRDAFFELEKSLIQRVIARIGIHLGPKQRAAVAQVHTADFDAFRSFGQGIAYFDQKKYTEALTALRQATTLDRGFTLARLTLADYERILTQLRSGALMLQEAQAEAARHREELDARARYQERQSRKPHEAALLKRLWELALRPGKAAQVNRLLAIHILGMLYRYNGQAPMLVSLLVDDQDAFAQMRIAEEMLANYWAESQDLYPLVPPFFANNHSPVNFHFAKDFLQLDFSDWFDKMGIEFIGTQNRLTYQRGELLRHSSVRGSAAPSYMLRLDEHQQLELEQKLMELASRLSPASAGMSDELIAFGEHAQKALELDRSTAAFLQALSQVPTNRVQQVTADVTAAIKVNQLMAQLLASPQAAQARYAWRHCRLMEGMKLDVKYKPQPDAFEILRSQRMTSPECHPNELFFNTQSDWALDSHGMKVSEYLLLGSHPVWQLALLRSDAQLTADDQGDARRSSVWRYRSLNTHALLATIVDGVEQEEPKLQFTAQTVPGRPSPELAILFGARDLASRKALMHAFAASIGPDRYLRLLELTQVEVDGYTQAQAWPGGYAPYQVRVLAQHPAPVPLTPTLRVAFQVAGDTLELRLNGAPYVLKAPDNRKGFYGLMLANQGEAVISQLDVPQAP